MSRPAPNTRYNDLFRVYAAWDRRRDGTWVERQPMLDWELLRRQAVAESGLDPDAVSPVGAKGLTQFMKGVPEESVLAYIAGFIDGEGTLSLHRQRYTMAEGGAGFHYYPFVMAVNTRREPLEIIQRHLGVGSVSLHSEETETQKRCYYWRAASRAALDAIGLIAPYFSVKRAHAILLLFEAPKFIKERKHPRWRDGRFATRTVEEVAELERIRVAFKELNAKGPPLHAFLEAGQEDEQSALGTAEADLLSPPEAPWPDLRLRRVAPRYWRTWEEWHEKEFGEFPLAGRYVNPFDPEDAVRAQADVMAWLLAIWSQDLRRALASYNFGLGNMRKIIDKHGDHWEEFLPLETKNYLKRILTDG